MRQPGERVDRAAPFVRKVAGPLRVPDDPTLAVRANGAVMAVAGLMLATGRAPRTAAATLAAAVAVTTYVGQPFWSTKDRVLRKKYRDGFMRNVALVGGLLHVVVDTEGNPGLRWRAKHRRDVKNQIHEAVAHERDKHRKTK